MQHKPQQPNPERIKELTAFHHQWLQDPMSKQVLQTLNNHGDAIQRSMVVNASNGAISDAQTRYFAVQLQTIETIKKLIYDTETFIARAAGE